MTNFEKKSWATPALEELSVTRTLGGPFTNFTEGDFGEPGHVVLGCAPDCADGRS